MAGRFFFFLERKYFFSLENIYFTNVTYVLFFLKEKKKIMFFALDMTRTCVCMCVTFYCVSSYSVTDTDL